VNRIADAAVAAGAAIVAAAWVHWSPRGAEPLLGAAGPLSAPAAEGLFTLVVFGGLLLLAVAGGFVTSVRVLAPGREPGRAALVGGALGLVGVLLSAGYAAIAGVVVPGASAAGGALIAGAVVVLAQVVAEEALFRGWLQPLLARSWGAVPAAVASAALFALVHIAGGAWGPLTLLNLFAGGLFFAALAARSGGIAAPVAAHWAWNAGEQLLLGLDPNPGVGSFGAAWDLELAGATLWGGSAQGLNASLAMLVALAAILAWVGPASLRAIRR
jgi:uncharacterized protein